MDKYCSLTGNVIKIQPAKDSSGELDCSAVDVSLRLCSGEIIKCRIDGDTYLEDRCTVSLCGQITFFYDSSTPIWSNPFVRAVAALRNIRGRMCLTDYVDENYYCSDGVVRLEVTPRTLITYRNGQIYPCVAAGHDLFVTYSHCNRCCPNVIYPDHIVVL